jgi:hypothetical protein
MAEFKRSGYDETSSADIGTGPYLARVISHLDTTFMGDLEVTLLRDSGNTMGEDSETYTVHFASPFFGVTPYEFMGQNKTDFNDTQKSYGMWMVPPDVGVTVMCTFVNGDPSQGYWFACIPPKFANQMVPAIAGTTQVELTDDDKKKYNTKMPLPTGEYNKKINAKTEDSIDVDKLTKPVHPVAEAFLKAGLLEDDVRGITTTTARREVPSMVFGISTPGPLDRRLNAKKGFIGKVNDQTTVPVPVSRLGGTTFVMDDGDDRYQRVKPANQGGMEYVDITEQKTGQTSQPDIPYNEYFRVRTRTGHQILMHNSEDLIYIANAKGTAWVELTANGKIDIYAADSISIHTETDLNIRADRDVNIEAGRNINMRTETGRWHAEVATNLEFLVNSEAKITVGENFQLLVGKSTKISSNTNCEINTNGDNLFSAGANTNIGSGGNHVESATDIFMNSQAATPASTADFVQPLELRDNPAVSTEVGWNPKKYQAGVTKSIMKRMPMHEPWLLHENMAPQLLTPDQPDREV